MMEFHKLHQPNVEHLLLSTIVRMDHDGTTELIDEIQGIYVELMVHEDGMASLVRGAMWLD